MREFLPPPGEAAQTCGPGPFSWADQDADRAMLAAAGFTRIERFERIDADICVGTTLDEAVDYQILVGPSGEIVREAGELGQRLGQRLLPEIRARWKQVFRDHVREDGIFLASSTWFIVARKDDALVA